MGAGLENSGYSFRLFRMSEWSRKITGFEGKLYLMKSMKQL